MKNIIFLKIILIILILFSLIVLFLILAVGGLIKVLKIK